MRWLPLLCIAATAFAEGRPLYGGAAQVALPGAPTAIDPLSPLLADGEVAALVFDRPFRLDAAGLPRPSLALSLDPPPPLPAAGLQPGHARLRLRPELRFSDGTPVRAADVAAALEHALRDPAGWTLAPIRSVRATSEDLIELELTRVAPDLALLLATPAAAIVSPRGAGTGPFLVETAALAGDGPQVRLVANAACPAGRAYLDAAVLRSYASRTEEQQSFEAGALEVARTGLSGYARRAGAVVDGPQTLTGWLALGRTLPEDLAPALKTLLEPGPQSAIDRERLRRLLREPSRAATTVGPSGPPWPARSAGEIAAARAQVQRHALKLGLLVDRSRPDDRLVAERVLVELSRLGVSLTLDVVDAATFKKRLAARSYDLALGVSAPPAADPGLSALALLAVVDPAAARAALARGPAQADPALLRDARVVPLFYRAARVTQAPVLHGLTVDVAGNPSLADTWRR